MGTPRLAQETSSLGPLRRRLEALQRRNLLRRLEPVEGSAEPWIAVGGRRLLNLSSNSYLGLATRPEIQEAAAQAARSYGCSAGASRLISGTHSLHEALEERLARFKGAQAALLYSSGYLANIGILPALVGAGDVVIGDELNHASIIDGCRLSRAEYGTYPHRDADALEAAFKRLEQRGHRGRRLVVTDTIFSMDGDLAPLPSLVELCERYGATLMVDEAHATGCLGPGGQGAVARFGLEQRVPVVMSTLSKAFGSLGAFVAGDELLRDYLINVSRSFIFTTALPPPVVAASLAALDVLEREPELSLRLQRHGDYLREGLRRLGFDTLSSETHIVPVRIGDAARTLEFAQRLRQEGVYAVAIRPPTVPPGASRVRASVMATHTQQDLEFALEAFGAAGRAVGLLM